jgi:hypothetical protein
MQIMIPIFSVLTIMIVVGQEEKLSMIIKDFVMINFIMQIDTMFGEDLPDLILDVVEDFNEGALKMPKDKNTYQTLIKRFLRDRYDLRKIFTVIMDITVNIWYTIIHEFSVVIYNYFGAINILLIQMLGYLAQDY